MGPGATSRRTPGRETDSADALRRHCRARAGQATRQPRTRTREPKATGQRAEQRRTRERKTTAACSVGWWTGLVSNEDSTAFRRSKEEQMKMRPQKKSVMDQLNPADQAVGAVMALGALNWGLVGLANFDLVRAAFGKS